MATNPNKKKKLSAQAEVENSNRERISSVRRSAVFLAIVAIVYIIYLVLSGQYQSFVDAMGSLDTSWVIAACMSYVVYYIFGVLAYVISVIKDPKCPLGVRDLMSVEATGLFFSNLTPNGAGGAPAQIYRLMRSGLSMGDAGAVQYTRFVIYEAGEGVFAALMLLFRGQWFVNTYADAAWLVALLLFGFKVIECIVLILVCMFPKVVTKVGLAILRFLRRRKWLKPEHDERWTEIVTVQVGRFSTGFRSASSNVGEMVLTMVVTLLQLSCLYALPWYVLHAFGQEADLLTCLTAGSILELLTSAIPLPGGTGGAEGGFAVLFGAMFGDSNVAAGYVVWRAVEYFLPVLAAMPLMTLRSDNPDSINHRWNAFKRRVKNGNYRPRFGRPSAGGISINPNTLKPKKSNVKTKK